MMSLDLSLLVLPWVDIFVDVMDIWSIRVGGGRHLMFLKVYLL